jgi:hypothetical protein
MPGLLIDSNGIGWANRAMQKIITPKSGFIVHFK